MHDLLDVLFGAKTPIEEVGSAARSSRHAVTHFVSTEGESNPTG